MEEEEDVHGEVGFDDSGLKEMMMDGEGSHREEEYVVLHGVENDVKQNEIDDDDDVSNEVDEELNSRGHDHTLDLEREVVNNEGLFEDLIGSNPNQIFF
mmetsp:Transcript_7238/g.13063  ORF Transcript_7238/g.13063 Transcript_7238/m.13063 type:complete len:99 (+) Transcript_7238:82-378(+)